MGALDRLSGLDAYPKVRNEFRVWTESGGIATLAALAVMFLLSANQLWAFWTREAIEQVVVDEALHDMLTIHFDLTFPKLQCEAIAIDAVDASGGQQSMSKHAVFKLPLDAEGHAVGHTIKQDAATGTVLSRSEAEKRHDEVKRNQGDNADSIMSNKRKPQHTACGSCYGVDGAVEPLKCCNSCKQVQEAFHFRGWEWRESARDRFWQCREESQQGRKGTEAEHRELEHRPDVGCDVFGSIFVAKAKGSFHFGPSANAGANMILVMLGLASIHFDVSHRVNSLWFGEHSPKVGRAALALVDSRAESRDPPLDGVSSDLKDPSIVQYYVKVVPTDVVFNNGTTVSTFGYAATEHVRPVGRGSLPSLHVFYDTPPLRLVYREHHKSWSHFQTNLCALTGGVFSVFGMLDALVYKNKLRSLRQVLRRRESGKPGAL